MATRKGSLSEEVQEKKVKAPAPRRDAEIIRARGALAKQPKEEVFIPIDPINPKDKVAYVAVNGYSYGIPKGKKVLVPKSVYLLLKRNGTIN